MRRTAVLAIVVVATLAGAGRAFAAQCGLPDSQPWWIDFSDGSVAFRNEVFGRPGVIAATAGNGVAATLRARGAQTIYWEMHLERLIGTNGAPAGAETVPGGADRLFDTAAASSACATPLVALNELLGQTTAPPWNEPTSLYRANVLAALDRLKARGARPFLLLPNSQPNLDGDGLLWWQRVAQDADLVREVYFNAPTVMATGPLLASRTVRLRLRDAVARLLTIGLPASRIGVMLGFHSGAVSGRSGLQPRESWLEYVKLNALAARQVAADAGIGSIWSWGWGTFESAADPDKPAAACVYLWTRDAKLCDGPSAAGPGFDASLTEGQIDPSPAVQCTLGSGRIGTAQLTAATALTRDRAVAYTALLARAVQKAAVPVTGAQIVAAERTIVRARFRNRAARYRALLAKRRLTVDTARSVIADEVRRRVLARQQGDVAAWTVGAEKQALDVAICRGDDFPAAGDVRLASYAPFLRLPA